MRLLPLSLLILLAFNTLHAQFLSSVYATTYYYPPPDSSGITSSFKLQVYTPSKLIKAGQWDAKFFNNLYTETKYADQEGNVSPQQRRTFFNSTLEIFTGLHSKRTINVGFITQFRSTLVSKAINSMGEIENHNPIEALLFQNNGITARSGWTTLAPAIRWAPIESWKGFSVQSAFYIPLVEQAERPIFLTLDSYIWENRLFYDLLLGWERKWQMYTELDINYAFGKQGEGFANNSLFLPATMILSYFPSANTTVYLLGQHGQRVGSGAQNYTQTGLGLKWLFTSHLQIEFLYTRFLRGNNTGLGQSYNIGLRYLYL